jgi:hypothetical protein
MRSTTGSDGTGTESLWRIPRTAAGMPVLMTADAGEALFQGSVNDLQVNDGMLRWVASSAQDPSRTELHAIPLSGGVQQVRTLQGQYTLSTYPMLYSGELIDPAKPELTNALTGQVTPIHTAQDNGVACDPLWCVMASSDDTGANTVELCHPDGTGLQRLGDANTSLVAIDPTLLDRFVPLSEQTAAMAATPNPTEQLFLYDIATHRSVEITGFATGTAAAGQWLWWSTGDNETLTWHALDISTLH